jgi:hypothetical protein
MIEQQYIIIIIIMVKILCRYNNITGRKTVITTCEQQYNFSNFILINISSSTTTTTTTTTTTLKIK